MATMASKNPAASGVPVVEKRKPVFIKVDQLKPGTQNHNMTVKVVSSNTVLQKPRSAAALNSRPTGIAECLIGDDTGTIVFTARNEQKLTGVGLHTASELAEMKLRMEYAKLRTLDLTKNDLVKDHLRHLMGSRSNVQNELLCRFIFPERPGALMKFLDAFSPRWNISLFHYRAQGETGANVLVGIQVSPSEITVFRHHADILGYEYVIESTDEVYQILMQ